MEFKKADVLYQKLGQFWYAFTEIDGEIQFTRLPGKTNPMATTMDITCTKSTRKKLKAKSTRPKRSARALA